MAPLLPSPSSSSAAREWMRRTDLRKFSQLYARQAAPSFAPVTSGIV